MYVTFASYNRQKKMFQNDVSTIDSGVSTRYFWDRQVQTVWRKENFLPFV